jgi:hypothetical protein
LRVVESASAIPAGREAIAALGPMEWISLAAQYRKHYGSSLLRGGDLTRWLEVLLGRIGKAAAHAAPAPRSGDAIPLYFPNRVEIDFVDGTTEREQVDLPSGSLAAPGMEALLREKFLRECAPALGRQGGESAFEAALSMESVALPTLVRMVSRSQSAPL